MIKIFHAVVVQAREGFPVFGDPSCGLEGRSYLLSMEVRANTNYFAGTFVVVAPSLFSAHRNTFHGWNTPRLV